MTQTDSSRQTDVSANLAAVRGRIANAAQAAGRDASAITLIAVSKLQDAASVHGALAAGQRDFAENRVQEAAAKWPPLCARWPASRLHLIGPLQTNKVREAVALFDVIHTLDRDKLARRMADAIAASGKSPSLLIQVNTGGEPQKAGVPPCESDGFIARCRSEYGLIISGLMCIPPENQPPAPHFTLLAQIALRNGIENLSMGMSGDFEIAIANGATHVRIGTAIFGGR